MSSQSASSITKVANSESSRFEIHCFACGHGDTILVRSPGPKWGLVDCALSNQAIRTRFFEYLERYDVQRLDYVVLTHPDTDHFGGMRAVIEHFQKTGRSIGVFADSGISARAVKEVFLGRLEQEQAEYVRLLTTVNELARLGKLRMRRLDESAKPIRIMDLDDKEVLRFDPIAPNESDTRANVMKAIERSADGNIETLSPSNNLYSIAMMGSLLFGPETREVLLAADVEPRVLERALDNLSSQSEQRIRFTMVKVPHHGSPHSHLPKLAAEYGRNEQVAIICAGNRPGLPSREVIADYMNRQWAVYCTTIRNTNHIVNRNRPSDALNRARRGAVTTLYDIVLSWDASGKLGVSPTGARIQTKDIGEYC